MSQRPVKHKEPAASAAGLVSDLLAQNVPFGPNDNLSRRLSPQEVDLIQHRVEKQVAGLLEALAIDGRDPNVQDTPKRVAKMLVREVFRGRYEPEPKMTDFPNTRKLDEIYVVGPIAIRSACSHHLVPVVGSCWIGVLPGERLIGLSKFTRLVEWYAARPQIQEELEVQIADALEQKMKPKGLAVIIRAEHSCMTWRGVRAASGAMTTSVMRGRFFDNPDARAEFLQLAKGHGL